MHKDVWVEVERLGDSTRALKKLSLKLLGIAVLIPVIVAVSDEAADEVPGFNVTTKGGKSINVAFVDETDADQMAVYEEVFGPLKPANRRKIAKALCEACYLLKAMGQFADGRTLRVKPLPRSA